MTALQHGLNIFEEEADAAHDDVCRLRVTSETDEADRMGEAERAKDEVAVFKGDETEEEEAAVVDSIEGGLRCAVVGERGVVAIHNDGGTGGEERFHGRGLVGIERDGEVALPVGALGRWAGAIFAQARGRKMENPGAIGENAGVMQDSGGRGDGNDGCLWSGEAVGDAFEGDELLDGDILGGEDAVKAFDGEEAAAVEDVGDVSLAKTCLAGEESAGENSAVDTAKEFKAKMFVHVPKVHGNFLGTHYV
jgi:hypothetical protein